MWVFKFDDAGLFDGKTNIKKPEEGEALPEGVTQIEPPEVGEGYQCRWNGGDWTIEIKRPVF